MNTTDESLWVVLRLTPISSISPSSSSSSESMTIGCELVLLMTSGRFSSSSSTSMIAVCTPTTSTSSPPPGDPPLSPSSSPPSRTLLPGESARSPNFFRGHTTLVDVLPLASPARRGEAFDSSLSELSSLSEMECAPTLRPPWTCPRDDPGMSPNIVGDSLRSKEVPPAPPFA